MKTIISLILFLNFLTLGLASGPWCILQNPGNCYLGWEYFSDGHNTGTIYDHECNAICNEGGHDPHYTSLQYDNHGYPPSPLYHFDTMAPPGHLSDGVVIMYYDYNSKQGASWNNRAPSFWYGNGEWGGQSGCTCMGSGDKTKPLDSGGVWGCRCPFPCPPFGVPFGDWGEP